MATTSSSRPRVIATILAAIGFTFGSAAVRADALAYDGFQIDPTGTTNYIAGNLIGQGVYVDSDPLTPNVPYGSGWSDNPGTTGQTGLWNERAAAGVNSGFTVTSGSLSYGNPGYGPYHGNGRMLIGPPSSGTTSATERTNNLANLIPVNADTNGDGAIDAGDSNFKNSLWLSILVELPTIVPTDGDDRLVFRANAASAAVNFGFVIVEGSYRASVNTGNAGILNAPGTQAYTGGTHLLVVRIGDNDGPVNGRDTATLWVDPDLGSTPTTATGLFLETGGTGLLSWNNGSIAGGATGNNTNRPARLRIDGVNLGEDYAVDEIKYGLTFQDVVAVPEPASLVLALAGGVAALRRRGR